MRKKTYHSVGSSSDVGVETLIREVVEHGTGVAGFDVDGQLQDGRKGRILRHKK